MKVAHLLQPQPFAYHPYHGERSSSTFRHSDVIQQLQKQYSTSAETEGASPAAPSTLSTGKKMSVMDVIRIRRQGKRKITMVTAYDYPSSVHVCRAGIDILLVGDSVGMVELGYNTTQPVTVEDMLHHCKVGLGGAHRSEKTSLGWSSLGLLLSPNVKYVAVAVHVDVQSYRSTYS